MSRFIDKLKRLSRTEAQTIGFRRSPDISPKPRIQLVASLAQESADNLVDYVTGADAGMIRITKISSGTRALQKITQAVSDIPWGGWLQAEKQVEIKQIVKSGGDFIVFPAVTTPLAILQNDEIGRILEIEASTSEGLLRAANELPLDAVLIATEKSEDDVITWQHLMLFQRFADLLTKPLLVSIPSNVTEGELQALWEAGIKGVIIEVSAELPQDRFQELRQIIDRLTFPTPRRGEKVEPLLPRVTQEPGTADAEEEEEE